MPVFIRLRLPSRPYLLSALLCAFLLTSPGAAAAQTLPPCKGSPLDSRIRIAVARCEVSAPSADQRTGDRLRGWLVRALIETSCFWVLDRAPAPDAAHAPGGAQLLEGEPAPQWMVTCRITEFAEQKNSGIGYTLLGGSGNGAGMTSARIGLLVQVLNPADRRVLRSRFFERKETRPGSANSTVFKSGAMKEAARKAVLDISAWLAAEREAGLLAAPTPTARPVAETAVCLSNADAASFARLVQALRALPGVQSVQQDLGGGSARLDVRHTCPVDDLLLALARGQVAVTGVRVEGRME